MCIFKSLVRPSKIKSGLDESGLVKQLIALILIRLRGLILNTEKDFVPKVESARLAVERARQIVKDNNDMITRLKVESNVQPSEDDLALEAEAENFSHEDSYAFDLYKIKSTNGVTDFIKDIFGRF